MKVTNPNYEDRFVDGKVTINAREITITAGSDSKIYDGTPLTKDSATGDNFAEGQVLDSVIVTGSQTEVGTSPNVASEAVIVDANGDDVTKNYDITYINGTLTVRSGGSSPGGGGGGVVTPPEESEKEPEEEVGKGDPVGSEQDEGIDLDEEGALPILNRDDHFKYIEGYPDNTVRPEGLITREEVAAVFYRLLDANYRETIKTSSNDFPDVGMDRWSSKHIGTLADYFAQMVPLIRNWNPQIREMIPLF